MVDSSVMNMLAHSPAGASFFGGSGGAGMYPPSEAEQVEIESGISLPGFQFQGRISAGLLTAIVLGMVAFYMSTRRFQL